MATRAEREKRQSLNDHHKKVLAQLIAKEDNKFCADCLAKGPRWVSWNLGVFLCIRCSGIHRSLGVHISKVKSVNLDTWTSDQLVKVCQRGNGWAKEKYEYNLPRDFKRPHTDSSMEYFIRDKYERMKYATNADVPLRSIEEFNVYMKSSSPKLKPNEKAKSIRNGVPIIRSINSPNKPAQPVKQNQPASTKQQQVKPAPITQPQPNIMDDLLGLDTPVKAPAVVPVQRESQPSDDLTDIFSCMQSNAASATTIPSVGAETPVNESSQNGSKQMSKDSILSLYSNHQPMPVQTNPYLNSGSYMTSQNQMTFHQGAPYQTGYSQVNMGQGNMNFPQQPAMQGFSQPYNWQQQQMQQQMQNMQLSKPGQGLTYGGMRSCNSMPQMSQPQGGAFWGSQMQPTNNEMLSASAQNHLRNSQPALAGLGSLGSWNNTQSNTSGQTLSTQLWK